MLKSTNSQAMNRKNNGRRNKSNVSTGSRKANRLSSSSIENVRKFQVHTNGLRAFISSINKLGKGGHEFTWHDIRKFYFKETQRTLTVEEFNGIFGTKSKTKRELFDLASVKLFLEPLDGTMLCRFRLIDKGLEEFVKSTEVDENISSISDDLGRAYSFPVNSPESSSNSENSEENSNQIKIMTDEDVKLNGPTSDLSKSEICDEEKHDPLSHQHSVQSSVTDDEGWASGRDTRSSNSSPPLSIKEKKNEIVETEFDEEKRMAAGSDEIDGGVMSTMLIVDEKDQNDVYVRSETEIEESSSSIVVTSSVEAAFKPGSTSYEISESENSIQNLSEEQVKVHATPRKLSLDKKEEDEKEISNDDGQNVKTSSPTIRKLIEKFDTAVNFNEVRQKKESSPNKSIYTQVLEEIEENGKQIEKAFKIDENNVIKCEEAKSPVVFRSTPTYSQTLAEGKSQLAEFVAEQEIKQNSNEDEAKDVGFAVKEQSSMSSLEKEYFDAKMRVSEDLFAELGFSDGFTPRISIDPKSVPEEICAEKSVSNESELKSEGLVTVIERNLNENVEDVTQQPIPSVRQFKKSECSVESDADIPYSLCSDDEAEPITTIENSMKPKVVEKKIAEIPKTSKNVVVVNVEIDPKSKREMAVDVSTPLKDRIAALHAAASRKNAPIAKVDSVEEEKTSNVIGTLNKTQEIETTVLNIPTEVNEVEEEASSPVPVRRRQGRFIRGCCVVM